MEFLPNSGCMNTTLQMHHMDANKMLREKSLIGTARECSELYGTKSWMQNQQNSSCTVTYLPFLQPSKLHEQDMRDTTGEARMN